MSKFLQLNDIEAYKKSYKLSNYVWDVVIKWDWFAKKSIGDQFVRSVDSVSANIAEGFGRHFKKDKVNFYRIARGSVIESLDWNQKAKERGLTTDKQYNYILGILKDLPRSINHLIGFTNSRLKN